MFYKGSIACILVYDLSRPDTLKSLSVWINDFLDKTSTAGSAHVYDFSDTEHQIEKICFFVLANKVDLIKQLDEPFIELETWCE